MERRRLVAILRKVRAGRLSVADALREIRSAQIARLGFATLDLERAVRRGFPEVVLGEGKTPQQLLEIVRRLHRAGQSVMVTRVGPEPARALLERWPKGRYEAAARIFVLRQGRQPRPRPGVVVISAGTADVPVAEEAAVTAEVLGCGVERIYDVGVAGLHRLVGRKEALLRARVIVVVAGMEGALPSVVAGLTACPVIGVPTSTGYGAGARGEAALLAMLNSCAGGLTVVNIDNGYGAGYAAALVNRLGR